MDFLKNWYCLLYLLQLLVILFFYREIIKGAIYTVGIVFVISFAALWLEAHKYPYYVSIVRQYEEDD